MAYKELADRRLGTSSASMREQVIFARQIQANRFRMSKTRLNGHMTNREIREHCQLDGTGQALLKSTMTELGFSARAHDKILRVSRTIADLEGEAEIAAAHLSEAINYRLLDRQLWT